jgi:hypothetical protein
MNKVTDLNDRLSFDVPILFILFNRPQHARRVLERLRQVRPTQLYVTIDGPRIGNNSDKQGVQDCIALLDEIDWPCTVTKLIRDQNLGCKNAVSQGITWFFDQVEAGIILEDDCLPDITFFDYCRVILEKYADEPKVMHISGCNLYNGLKWGQDSYFFSNIPHIWGWATWRRAWVNYDSTMADYPAFLQAGGIKKAVRNSGARMFWKKVFDVMYSNQFDTWDHQWVFAVWRCGGVCVTPNQNLITNIGFDEAATHTNIKSAHADLQTVPIDTQAMRFPDKIELNEAAIEYASANFYQLPSWWSNKLKALRRLATAKLF